MDDFNDEWLLVFLDPVRDRAAWDIDKFPPGLHGKLVLQGLKVLKPGFRHVFALQSAGCEGWLVVDNRINGLGVSHVDFDYIITLRALEKQGYAKIVTVHKTHCEKVRGLLGFGFLSCVAVMRRLLGITAPVWTPYALYRHVRNKSDGIRI